MSIFRHKKLKCPDCGCIAEAVIWDSINVQLNPESREKLILGDLHKFECPQCKTVKRIETPFLYHDMHNEFMVWFYPIKSLDDPAFFNQFSCYGHLDCTGGLEDDETPEYAKDVHFVFSMDEMVRYIMFREKLADIKNIPIKVEYAE